MDVEQIPLSFEDSHSNRFGQSSQRNTPQQQLMLEEQRQNIHRRQGRKLLSPQGNEQRRERRRIQERLRRQLLTCEQRQLLREKNRIGERLRRQRAREMDEQRQKIEQQSDRCRQQLLTDEQRQRIREANEQRERIREANRIRQRLCRERARIAQLHKNDDRRYHALITMHQDIPTTTEGEIAAQVRNYHEELNQSGGIRSISNQRRLRLTELRRQARFIIDQPINELQSQNMEDAHRDEEMEPAQSQGQTKAAKENPIYVTWTDAMDRVLTDTLIEQVHKGNKVGLQWKSVAFTAVIHAIKEKCDVHVTKDNIQRRLKTWAKTYNIVTELINQSGFGWDDNRNMIVVDDDVWQNYIKAHPKVKSYRWKVIKNYNELSIIIGNNRAKGGDAMIGTEINMDETSNERNNSECDVDNEGVEDIIEGREVEKEAGPQNLIARPSTSSIVKGPPRKKVCSGDALTSAVTTMTETLKSMVEVNTRARLPTMDVERLYQEVSKIPDIDRVLTLRAVDMLVADKNKEHVFYGLPEDVKRDWLMMHLGLLN